jgi:hypothetical protein
MVRNFDITTTKQGGIAMLHVKGLRTFTEAYQYMHRLYADPSMAAKLSGIRALLISESNMELLLKHYSIDEYIEFYEQHFIALPEVEGDTDSLDEIRFED